MDHVDTVLAQWAVERPDLDVSPMGVVGRLSRAARLADTAITRTFAAHGLDPAGFDVLATLRRNGPPHAMTPTDLGRSAMVTSGAITQRLDRLEQQGLVRRSRRADDGRGVLVRLTPKGSRLVDAALPDHLDTEAALLDALSPSERANLARLLRKLLIAHDR